MSNDGSLWSTWDRYVATALWNLAPGPDGSRAVYARFRDKAANISPVFSDTIILDTSPPTGSITINGGAGDTNSQGVLFSLSAADGLSGVGQMSFSNDGQNYGIWQDYATSSTWTLAGGNGSKTIYARYRDNAGNISSAVTATIYLNTNAPTSSVDALSPYQNSASFPVSWSGTAQGNGLASFDIQYKDGPLGRWTDWITTTLTTTAIFTGIEGHRYYFQSRARDLAGNVETYVGNDGHTDTLVDLTNPTGSVSINNGALDSTSVTVTLSLSVTDSLSGISKYSFSSDGTVFSDWENYSTIRQWGPAEGDGTKAVWARFQDGAGNVSTPVSDTINLDTTVRGISGLSVNDGALFTNQITVTLSLPGVSQTSEMIISNDGAFASAEWEPYSAYKLWQITQYGSYVLPRTVYVKYKDSRGNVYATSQDDIILDVNAPSGSVSIEGAGSNPSSVTSMGSAVNLRLSATDDASGLSGMIVSNSPALSLASWEQFSASKQWSLDNAGKVYVAFKDKAGNTSPTYEAAVSGGTGVLPSPVVSTVHPKLGGSIISRDIGTIVSFPPGAVGAKAKVTLVPVVDYYMSSNTGTLKSASKFVTMTAKSGETAVTSFSKAYTMAISYSAADIVGVNEDTLAIYTWDGTGWVKETGSSVNNSTKTVSAAIDHLSSFALLGESSTKKTYLPLVVRESSGW